LCTLVAVPRQTRNRQLARQAALRRAQKRQQQRKRQVTTIAVALVVALVGGVLIFSAFLGGDGEPVASPSPSPSQSPSLSEDPGTKTGTVDPEPGPDMVACGGEVPDGARKPKPQFNAPAQVLEGRHATYTATIETSCGDIVVELLADAAPQTVNSFVFLAQEGYFDGTRIHRLDTSLDVIQGGDPVGTGANGPGYTIPDELQGGESYGPGVFAMANSGPDSGGSQFFLVTGNNGRRLDANPAYTIFGNVIEGLDVAREIQALPIQDPEAAAAGDLSGQQPAQAVYVEKVTISIKH
jgi:peptidyl-prolyl cis-trans isomerase B (cyclophilin B)